MSRASLTFHSRSSPATSPLVLNQPSYTCIIQWAWSWMSSQASSSVGATYTKCSWVVEKSAGVRPCCSSSS